MITGVAFCPQPPVLLPEVSGAAAGELDDLRAACDRAVGRVLRPGPGRPTPSRVVLVCAADQGPVSRSVPPPAVASLRGLGLPLRIPLDPARTDGEPILPVAAAVGARLLDRAGWSGGRLALVLRRGLEAPDCEAAGAGLAADPEPTALFVLGDGAACHGDKAPGYVDADAGPFDSEVAAALRSVDDRALMALDPARCTRLLVAGREAWQASAGGVAAARASAGATWRGSVEYRAAPYGVGYLVATWLPDPAGP